MSWFRKRVVPQMLQILLLLFAVAVATDGLAAQNAFLTVTPTLGQALCNDDPGASEDQIWKVPKYVSVIGKNSDSQHLAGSIYLDKAAGPFIPAPRGMFSQPDRAPPDSFSII